MSIVNPKFSFSVTATINDKVVVFLVDTGSALTILHRDTWEKCKEPQQQLVPWCQSKLVGAEGSQLHVFGSAVVKLSIGGESFELSVVVIDPLTSEAILGLDVLTQCTVDLSHGRLITGAGHVVNLYCQGQGRHLKWETNLVDVGEHETVNTSETGDICEAVNTSESVSTSEPVNTSEPVDTDVSDCQSVLEQLVDISLSQEECENNSHAHVPEGFEDVFHTADISDAVEISQVGGSGHVLTVKVIDNIRIPAFSELEILAQVKGDGSHCYMLEGNLKNSDLLVARAVVMPGEVVPVRLMNPTGGSINLYSGASVAVLSEVAEVMNDQPKKCDIVENTVVVSAVNDDRGYAPLEEMLIELVRDTSLSSHHQDLLLTLLIDYSDVFARSKDELGRTDVLQHEIAILMVHLLFVSDFGDYPQREGKKCV